MMTQFRDGIFGWIVYGITWTAVLGLCGYVVYAVVTDTVHRWKNARIPKMESDR